MGGEICKYGSVVGDRLSRPMTIMYVFITLPINAPVCEQREKIL